jgi:GntR family transcriptional regulator/MocR family aminotransferase
MKRAAASFFPPIALGSRSKNPLYRQLYDWFRNAILSGQLRPGQRVPSTRGLAAELKISRIPVLNAYEQLHAEGYLQTFTGSGTVVAGSIPDEASRPKAFSGNETARARGPRKLSRDGVELLATPPEVWLTNLGAFRVSLPALDHFPLAVWSRLVARHARQARREAMAYGTAMGSISLRGAIAEYLGAVRAVRCDASQIMVVTGSQQALQLTARVLLNPKDRVWIEEPGYPGAHQALKTFGAQLVPIPVDDEGLNVSEGLRRSRSARAVYITPSHQYPLGSTLSAARRMRLLDWAVQNGSWVIEDDYDSEYRFGSRPIGSLQGLDTDERVIYIGTFSKVLFPSLRIGYVIIPKDLIPAFVAARDAADIFSSTLYQLVLNDFIRGGHFARHIRRMRLLYMERRNLLVGAIEKQIGAALEVVSAEAGMHLVGLLPPGVDDSRVAQTAAKHGISVVPLSSCCLRRPARGGLILGYGGTDERQIQEGVRKLAVILREAKA